MIDGEDVVDQDSLYAKVQGGITASTSPRNSELRRKPKARLSSKRVSQCTSCQACNSCKTKMAKRSLSPCKVSETGCGSPARTESGAAAKERPRKNPAYVV